MNKIFYAFILKVSYLLIWFESKKEINFEKSSKKNLGLEFFWFQNMLIKILGRNILVKRMLFKKI